MRLIEKLRKGSNIQLFFTTILIIPFQTILLIPVSLETLTIMRKEPSSLFQNNPLIVIGFFILPIIYCIVVSLFFQPKRIVSPIYIQIGTFFLLSQIVLNSILSAEYTLETLGNVFISLIFIFIIIIEIGFFQFFIVRWVIGLNYDDVEIKSFVINLSPKGVIDILRKSNFQKSGSYKITKLHKNTDNPIWILKLQDFKNYIIIAFGNYRNEKNKCVLSTVAYHKDLSWISKSSNATETRNSIVNDIKQRLKDSNDNLKIESLEKVDDEVSITVFGYIEHMVNSKINILINFFKKISKVYNILIGATIIVFIIITFIYYMNWINVDTYTTGIIAIILAFIIEFGIPLKDEISFKKGDEFS